MSSRVYGTLSATCFESHGKWSALHGHPQEDELIGIMTRLTCNQHSTMTGIYVCRVAQLASNEIHEQRIRKGLHELVRLDLVRWDERFNLLYIPSAAIDQMNLTTGRIKEKDGRLRAVRKQVAAIEQLVGQHPFIDDWRQRYLPDLEVSSERGGSKGGSRGGVERGGRFSSETKFIETEKENSSERGGSKGGSRPPSDPDPDPAPDLFLREREGGVGEERGTAHGPIIPGNTFRPSAEQVQWASRTLGLTKEQIEQTTEEYEAKCWMVNKPARQHFLSWKGFARNIAERAANGGANGQGAATDRRAVRGRAGAQSSTTRAADGGSGAGGDSGSGGDSPTVARWKAKGAAKAQRLRSKIAASS